MEGWYRGLLANTAEISFLPVSQRSPNAPQISVPIMEHPHNDSLIAASAQVHSLTLVTRNVSDFSQVGISLANPWGD
ncbi:MAG: type II toxin-antitoxin system VapC family toxin [Akkermansiaceae bacterium]|nr:type II toxin-antitoxin system VapC family toxin [Akkermansiaceae bacterium]